MSSNKVLSFILSASIVTSLGIPAQAAWQYVQHPTGCVSLVDVPVNTPNIQQQQHWYQPYQNNNNRVVYNNNYGQRGYNHQQYGRYAINPHNPMYTGRRYPPGRPNWVGPGYAGYGQGRFSNMSSRTKWGLGLAGLAAGLGGLGLLALALNHNNTPYVNNVVAPNLNNTAPGNANIVSPNVVAAAPGVLAGSLPGGIMSGGSLAGVTGGMIPGGIMPGGMMPGGMMPGGMMPGNISNIALMLQNSPLMLGLFNAHPTLFTNTTFVNDLVANPGMWSNPSALNVLISGVFLGGMNSSLGMNEEVNTNMFGPGNRMPGLLPSGSTPLYPAGNIAPYGNVAPPIPYGNVVPPIPYGNGPTSLPYGNVVPPIPYQNGASYIPYGNSLPYPQSSYMNVNLNGNGNGMAYQGNSYMNGNFNGLGGLAVSRPTLGISAYASAYGQANLSGQLNAGVNSNPDAYGVVGMESLGGNLSMFRVPGESSYGPNLPCSHCALQASSSWGSSPGMYPPTLMP